MNPQQMVRYITVPVLTLCIVALLPSIAAATDDSLTIVVTGELHATKEWRDSATHALVRAQVILRARYGTDVYAIPYTCEEPSDCLSLDTLCPVTATSTVTEGGYDVTTTGCTTFVADYCYLVNTNRIINNSAGDAEIVMRHVSGGSSSSRFTGPIKTSYSLCTHADE